MPNRDKTGPQGMGPMTGRGLGRCGKRQNHQPQENRPRRNRNRRWFVRALLSPFIIYLAQYNMARTKCEVWSRVCGYLRPTSKWNDGKTEEFKDRTEFSTD